MLKLFDLMAWIDCAVFYLSFCTLCQVNEFLAGMGTEAPDVEEENIISRPSVSYDDMWAKTLLESSELEV